MRRKGLLWIFSLFLSAVPVTRADGFLYTDGVFTAVAAPGAASSTAPSGINDQGQIVGTSADGAFVDSNGTFSNLAFAAAPGASVEPAAINNLGQIAGSLTYSGNSNPGYLAAGFVDSSGSISTVLLSPPYETFVTGINNLGQVVGNSCAAPAGNTSGPCEAFLDIAGIISSVIDPNATNGTLANGMNDQGQIVGVYGTATGNLGFVDNNGVFTTISFPGASSTFVTGINDKGEIVGYYCDQFGVCQSFTYDGGVFTSISAPDALDTYAYGINNAGQIVGSDIPAPVSEGETLTSLVTGLIGLAILLGKRKFLLPPT